MPGDGPVMGFETMQVGSFKNLYVWKNGLILFDRGAKRWWARVPKERVDEALEQLEGIGVFEGDLLKGMMVPDGPWSEMWATSEVDTWRTGSCHEYYANRTDVVLSERGIEPAKTAGEPSEEWRRFINTWREAKQIMSALIPETVYRYATVDPP